jgi:hypothetical protein
MRATLAQCAVSVQPEGVLHFEKIFAKNCLLGVPKLNQRAQGPARPHPQAPTARSTRLAVRLVVTH